jgi:hypothetical protein
MAVGMLTLLNGCDIGCDCEGDIDDLIPRLEAEGKNLETFDVVDSVDESVYTLVFTDELTDEQIANGEEAFRYEYVFRWGDNVDECCIKTATKTLITDTGTDTDTGTGTDTDTGTGTDTDTDTGTDTDTDTGTGTDTGTDTDTDTDTIISNRWDRYGPACLAKWLLRPPASDFVS